MSRRIPRNAHRFTRRAAAIFGLGYLLLIVAPVTTASLLLIVAGYELVGVALLSVLIAVSLFSLLAAGFAWLLARSVMRTLSSFLRNQRRGVLYWADDLETRHWWARVVRPSERLGFLDDRSAEEKLDGELDRLQRQYVSGELSVIEFERALDRLLWTGTRTPAVDSEPVGQQAARRGRGARYDAVEHERVVR